MQRPTKPSIIISSMKDTSKTQAPPVQAHVISNPFEVTTSHNVQSTPAVTDSAQTQVVTDKSDSPTTPSAAADNDLIEKTWIHAVDKMAREHGDDPFTLQQKQAELTRDYLKKRFGREIKAS